MMLQIRREEPVDAPAIRQIHEHTFGQLAEADLVDRLRTSCPVTLSLVAVKDTQLIGHILFTPAVIEYADGARQIGMGLAPLAVLPEFQRQGIGSALIQAGLDELQRSEQAFVIVLGHPEYYARFGFETAAHYQISCEFAWDNPDAFMIHLLNTKGVLSKKGLAQYHPEFSSFS